MRTHYTLCVLALILAVSAAPGSEVAIESTGFTSLAGESSDDTFAVSGSFIVMVTTPMRVDEIEIAGSLVSVAPNRSLHPDGGTHDGELIVNGSFENTAGTFQGDGFGLMSLAPGSEAIPGWTTTTAELAWVVNGNSYDGGSADGALFLDLTGYHDAPPYGGITQLLATVPGQTYRLSFALGSHEGRSNFRGPMEVAVDLGALRQVFIFEASGAGRQWGTFTWDFTADSATTPLGFQGVASEGGAYLGLDDISVLPGTEVPRASIIHLGANELIARFPVEPGLVYAVESLENMAAGDWLIVPDTTQVSTGPALDVILPFRASEPHRFFRVRQIP